MRTFSDREKSTTDIDKDNLSKAAMNLHDCLSLTQVLNTVFWLGKAANGVASYAGPALNLKEFEGLLAQMKVVSGGGGRGRSVTFPPLPGLPEGRGKGRGGRETEDKQFCFSPAAAFPYFRERQKRNRVRSRKDDWLNGFYVLGFVVSHAGAGSH